MAYATGSISTENLAPDGDATAGSEVVFDNLVDVGTVAIGVSGTHTGALTVQGRVNNGPGQWATLQSVAAADGATVSEISSAATGLWQVNAAGFDAVRVTALAAVTGSASVILRSSKASLAIADVDAVLQASDLQIGAVEVKDATTENRLIIFDDGRAGVDPLGTPGVSRQLAAVATSANTVLTSTVRRASLYARSADARYVVGSTAQTASATSHFIAAGERLDIALPDTPNIAVIRAGSTDAVIEISELV